MAISKPTQRRRDHGYRLVGLLPTPQLLRRVAVMGRVGALRRSSGARGPMVGATRSSGNACHVPASYFPMIDKRSSELRPAYAKRM